MCSLENMPSRIPTSKVDAIKVPSSLTLGRKSHSQKWGLDLETVVFVMLVNVPMPKTSVCHVTEAEVAFSPTNNPTL